MHEVRQELENLVASLREEARLDSSGRFTLDPTLALSKMTQFQHQDTSELLLWVAASAIAGGATTLRAQRGLDQLGVEYDGLPLEEDDFNRLLGENVHLLPHRVGHLSFALLSALASDPEELILESGWHQMTYRPGETRVDRLTERAPKNRLLLLRPRRNWPADALPEARLLQTRIPRQLLRASLNTLSNTFWVASELLHDPHYWGGSVDLSAFWHAQKVVHHDHAGEASVLLNLRTWRACQGEVDFLYHGVLFPTTIKMGFPFRALVAWPGLQLDLTRRQMVETEEYRQILELIQAQAIEVAEGFLDRYPDFLPGIRETAGPWLEFLQQHFLATQQTHRAERCQALLRRHHRQGSWESRQESARLLRNLLQKLPAPARPQSDSPPKPPARESFWGWLREWLVGPPFPAPQGGLDASLASLRSSTAHQRKWQTGLSGILEAFDPDSYIRLGMDGLKADPDWLSLEGILPDGAHVVILAEGSQVELNLHYPQSGPQRPCPTQICPPAGWDLQVESGPPLRLLLTSSSQHWHEPAQLLAVFQALLSSLRETQQQESLPCPGCRQPMEKVVLDVVLDRCPACLCTWLDYAEFDWLRRAHPALATQAPPPGGLCPRCHLPLQDSLRCDRPVADCPRCRGLWMGPIPRAISDSFRYSPLS